ncbi:MAG: ribosome maturation factor RimP [Mariprofundus sp.]|nr:ribosome maturation factor RimP [Mariprofundus sp.]
MLIYLLRFDRCMPIIRAVESELWLAFFVLSKADDVIETKIESLLKPITDELGVEIVKIKLGNGKNPLLRVTVYRPDGVDSVVLERISRGLALQLDVEDPISGNYRLEVSTPGLDWPLTTATDFNRYKGEWLKVQFVDGHSQEGRNLGATEEDSFILQVAVSKRAEDEQLVIEMRDVSKVVRTINWKEVSRGSK